MFRLSQQMSSGITDDRCNIKFAHQYQARWLISTPPVNIKPTDQYQAHWSLSSPLVNIKPTSQFQVCWPISSLLVYIRSAGQYKVCWSISSPLVDIMPAAERWPNRDPLVRFPFLCQFPRLVHFERQGVFNVLSPPLCRSTLCLLPVTTPSVRSSVSSTGVIHRQSISASMAQWVWGSSARTSHQAESKI